MPPQELREIVQESIDALTEGGRPDIQDIAQHVVENYSEEYLSYQASAAWRGLLAFIKDALRARFENPSGLQLRLPGMALPGIIAVRERDRVYYVKTVNAKWHEIVAGREERKHNVEPAQAKLDDYDASMDLLRSKMENTPEMTVGEALRILATEDGLENRQAS